MKKLPLACLAAVLAGAAAVHAAPLLSRDEVKARTVRIEEQYDHAQARCQRLQAHARELCQEQARGERDVQAAELQKEAEPSVENDQKLRMAKAQAAYALALMRCKPLDGGARGVCRDDAKRTLAEAKAEARLQMEVAAQTLHAEHMVRVRTSEEERAAAAQYQAARKRCEALPPEGRGNCIADIRARFGR